MSSRDRFLTVCSNKITEKGLSRDIKDRFVSELTHIDVQRLHDYFLDLYDRKAKVPENEHNALTPWLLGIVDDFDPGNETAYKFGEMPDIDVDFLPMIRDWLKNVWALKEFGKDNVCAIGNYTTFGIKSSLLDVARVYGLDRNAILSLTTEIEAKDNDGKPMTWQAATNLYPDLRKYCKFADDNSSPPGWPKFSDAVKRLLDRNRGMGMHAGGLIVSNSRIDNLVPLVRGKDGQHVSAFVEGLHGTDLGPLGLIKFDLLVIIDLLRIVECCRLIKERHPEVTSICAKEGLWDWSDTSYLNDPEALKIASKGNLKGIFQFDSDGIRALAKRGGVDSFDDLCAYNALYRPGPLNCGMDKTYIKRKQGEEKYYIHPLLQPILGKTYEVMIYQEQVMQMLNVVGDIPLTDCEIVRKAISKKKIELFSEYKDMFIANGQKNLKWDREKVVNLWNQIESFAEYGFNLSHTVAYTYISSRLLYLKAHYPLEFFTAALRHAPNDVKIKEYKLEAEKANLKVRKIDINKSKVAFNIIDKDIFIGFSNVKGIGPEVAQRIVDNQPYHSFSDFLEKFGTDASVVKPLIGLCAFQELLEHPDERSNYWEFNEYYKKEIKRRYDRQARYEKTKDKHIEELTYIIISDFEAQCDMETGEVPPLLDDETKIGMHKVAFKLLDDMYKKGVDVETNAAIMMRPMIIDTKAGWKIYKKYRTSRKGNETKVEEDGLIKMDEFEPTGEIDEKVRDVFKGDERLAEKEFYGFGWKHEIESAPGPEEGGNYEGRTFSQFDEKNEGAIEAVEVLICRENPFLSSKNKKKEFENPRRGVSKKNEKVVWYDVCVEDANWEAKWVRFWEYDYNIYAHELYKGNWVSIRVVKPQAGFRNFTFRSFSRMERSSKAGPNDGRLMVIKRPEQVSKPIEDEVMENVINQNVIEQFKL